MTKQTIASKNKKKYNQAYRKKPYYKEYQKKYRKEHKERFRAHGTFLKRKRSDGICIFCGEINWYYLEDHHPYPNELPDTTFTLCANCHTKLHFLTGGNRHVRK